MLGLTAAGETLMFAEAAEAAAAAERQLACFGDPLERLGRRLRELDPPFVITCARGSSDHAATFAKYLIETRVQTPVASHAPSTSSVYQTAWRKLKGALFLAISQSGQSPDLILSARSARDAGALVVALVNDPASPLAEVAELTIPILAGPERSVAATKSYIASLLALAQLVAAWTEEEELADALTGAPRILRNAWALDWSPAVEPLSKSAGLYVLGRGMSLGIAQEAALKLKETCGLHAEAYSAAEVKHGPMAIVGAGFPVLMLVPNDEARDAFEPLARDFIERGARVILAGTKEPGALTLPVLPGLHPVLAPIASIQSFYGLAAELSLARGFHPDRPPHLSKVTETR
ncbi:MAG: SIS domain-containing protein [Pseudomonadota bacterium]|nr:SIS domain-containing protein [Pseudomonadota bacterium]